VAELGGAPVSCDVEGCTRGARTLLVGGAMICRQHFEAGPDRPVGKPMTERLVGAVASVLGG
jgi:hypothetical protein